MTVAQLQLRDLLRLFDPAELIVDLCSSCEYTVLRLDLRGERTAFGLVASETGSGARKGVLEGLFVLVRVLLGRVDLGERGGVYCGHLGS